MSRMEILNAVEQEQLESPPVFNSVQRKQYFDFSSELLTLAQDLQTPTNQVCFLVSCGYFCQALLPEPPVLATRPRLRRATAWVSARVDRCEQLFCNDPPS